MIVGNLSCDVAEALQSLAVGTNECFFVVIIKERARSIFLVVDTLKIVFLGIEYQCAVFGCTDENVALLVFKKGDTEWISADVGQVFVYGVVLVEA